MADRFIDPITLDIMVDPVIAADGVTYDRASIQEWIEVSKRNGQSINSPMTNLPLSSETLKPNSKLKREIEDFKASKGASINPSDIHFTLTSEIYKELDQINSLPVMEELNLKPPTIVVIGNESHGKSTLLERIIGLPLFPKEKGICTRCLIRVHLRRSRPGVSSIAEISVKTKTPNHGSATNGNEISTAPTASGVQIAALDNIRQKVQETMNELLRNDPQQRIVLDDKEIVIKINLPYCLNIDILDVPGLVTTSPTTTQQNLPEVTHNLALRVVNEEKASAIFLLVNDVKLSPNQSKGCAIIQEAKVEGQTLGIFTKLDTFVSEDGDEAAELADLLQGKARGSFEVKYGWMATSSKKVDSSKLKTATPELSALYQMSERENEVFQRFSRSPMSCRRLLGIDNIRQRIQHLYERFIASNWVEAILQSLNDHKIYLEDQLTELGMPLPPDPDYTKLLKNKSIPPSISLFDAKALCKLVSEWLTRLVAQADAIWIKLPLETTFWDNVQAYHNLFYPEASSDGYQSRQSSSNYPNFPAPVSESRVVAAADVQNATNRIESIVKKLFKEITDVLVNKLQPTEGVINLLSDAICRYGVGTFNLQRFPGLIERINRVLKHRLELAYNSFRAWVAEFIEEQFSESMFFTEYFLGISETSQHNRQDDQNGKVLCSLRWSSPLVYKRLPHKVLDKFFEVLRLHLNELPNDIPQKDLQESSRVENCKEERLKHLGELVTVLVVSTQIQGFASQVQKLTNAHDSSQSLFIKTEEQTPVSKKRKRKSSGEDEDNDDDD